MQIYNPTENKISVQIEGLQYSIGPKQTISNVQEKHAKFWQSKIHNFLVLSEDVKIEKTKEDVQEIIEEIKESINSDEEIKEEETQDNAVEVKNTNKRGGSKAK